MKIKIPCRCLAAVVAAAALLWIASYFTIRNLGGMLGGIDDTLGEIGRAHV